MLLKPFIERIPFFVVVVQNISLKLLELYLENLVDQWHSRFKRLLWHSSIGLSITQVINQSKQAVEHSMLFIRRDGTTNFTHYFFLLHARNALYWLLPYNVVGMLSFPHLMLGSR